MRNSKTLLPLIILFLIILSRFLFGDINGISFCSFSLIVVAIAIIVYFISQQRSELKDWWVRPSNILLFGLMVVNMQYILDLCMGYKSYSSFGNANTVNYCCALGALGVLSFLIGNVFSCPQYNTSINDQSFSRKIGCKFLYIIQAVSLIGWLMSVNVIALVTGALYADQTWGGGLSANLEALFYDATITILVVTVLNGSQESNLSVNGFIRLFGFSFWFFVGLYLVMRLLSGDRGPFIYTTLSLFFSYILISKKKISLKYVALVGFLFMSLMIVVGVARGMSFDMALGEKASSAIQSLGKARFSDATVFTPTEELAYSFRCNETAVNEIQSGAHYHYGKYQLYAILNCIPFMPSFMYSTLGIPITELSSDYYLTECYFGDYNISGQIGTTVVAEFFLEFGLLGVIVGMFILGLFFKKVDSNICIKPSTCLSVIAMIIAITFASRAVYIPRSNFLSQLKPTIIILIMFYTNKMISRK